MPVPDLSKLSETELLSLVHAVLTKPGNLTKVDELDLRVINQELKRRNDDATKQISAIEVVHANGTGKESKGNVKRRRVDAE